MSWTIPQNTWVALDLASERGWRELRAALPLSWRNFFSDAHWHAIAIGESLITIPADRPVALNFPADEILLRQIELPLVGRLQLPNLMSFEAPRHVPLPLDQVKFDFRVVARNVVTGRMVVELAIIRTEVIEDAQQWANANGWAAEAIAITTLKGRWFARRLLVRRQRDVWFNARIRRLALRAVIPLLLIAAWVLAAQTWATRLVNERDGELATARAEALKVAPLRTELVALNDRIAFLASARGRPSTAIISEEVARLLPDDAWLQELVIDGSSVHLRGTARHATSLLSIFSASALFKDVKFEAPLTAVYGSSGDQFDIVMMLN